VLEHPFVPAGRRKRKNLSLLFNLCGHEYLPSLAIQRHILTRGRRRSTRTGNILLGVATTTDYQELLDYRRSVSSMYAGGRGETAGSPPDTAARCGRFRAERDDLFAHHPQSPLAGTELEQFARLDYFDYDPSLRFALPVEYDVDEGDLEITLQDDGPLRLRRFGRVRFRVEDEEYALSLFWISGYGGGILLPFRDQTGAGETYGGGRYLLDTIKHTDLGSENGDLVIDFNYAYNPSCAYDPRWHCPLAPAENNLPVRITAGEKRYGGQA
jgi:uncharacterized protein (DUF1684 family)